MNRVLLVTVVAALPLAALAQTYKWKDQYGQVHYSQTPPPDTNIKTEKIGPALPPSSNPNQEALNKALTDAQNAEPVKQKAAEQAAAEQERRQTICKDAMNRLAFLDSRPPGRIATQDDKGNVTRMTPDEYSKQRATEQDRIAKNCN